MERTELIDRLRDLVLLELLDEDQLAWLADVGEVLAIDAGTELIPIGAELPGLYILLEGEFQIVRDLNGAPTLVVSSTTPGVWTGAIPFADEGLTEFAVRCPRTSSVLHLTNERFVELVKRGVPIFHHLLRGVRDGTLRYSQRVSDEERLASLGRLSAGLAHELNNPAAAARRGAARLPDAIWELQGAVVRLVLSAGASVELGARLREIEAQLLEEAAQATPLAPLERSRTEDDVLDALTDAGVEDADDLVESLVDSGIDGAWLERIVEGEPPVEPDRLLTWVGRMAEVRQLIGEIEIASGRIADLVGSIKAYSYMDRAGGGAVDVHAGIDATIAVLRHRLRSGVKVDRHYDLELPEIEGHAGELNQVWTNLISNASDAMEGEGTLTIRTGAETDGRSVRIEFSDSGPGVPTADRTRIFDPFFTTKGVGEGSGLGLDIVRRIVVDGHGGSIEVEEAPGGGARFLVRLPVGSA